MSNVFGITARAFRWYDDGTETGATELAAESANHTLLVISDAPIVLRYGVQESGSGSASGASTDDYQLQYELNDSGTWVSVTTSSTVVQGFTSANLTDAGATTQRLSAGTGSFIAGEISETDGLLTDWQLTANNHSELLFAIQVIAADTAANDTIDFRVLRNGSVFNTYSVTPRITVTTSVTSSADGSSSGVATVSGIGSATAITSGTAPGTSTVSGVGRAIVPSAGTSAGTSTGSGAGVAFASAIGSSPCVATAAATGRSTSASIASSAGVGSVSAAGSSTAVAAASSAGTSVVSAVGLATSAAIGSSAGTSTVTGVAQSDTTDAAGSVSGTATATAIGASFWASVGIASGTATAAATGSTVSAVAASVHTRSRRRDRDMTASERARSNIIFDSLNIRFGRS